MSNGWIGVDFDGTLAVHESMEVWDGSIGDPVWPMIERVKSWLAAGVDVRILTARVAPYPFSDSVPDDARGVDKQRAMIEDWCEKFIGQKLPVTCSKDYGMRELWDDRAVRVRFNTGERCCEE